jgi:hypothetical protein
LVIEGSAALLLASSFAFSRYHREPTDPAGGQVDRPASKHVEAPIEALSIPVSARDESRVGDPVGVSGNRCQTYAHGVPDRAARLQDHDG